MAADRRLARETRAWLHGRISGQSADSQRQRPDLGSMYVLLDEFDKRHGSALVVGRH